MQCCDPSTCVSHTSSSVVVYFRARAITENLTGNPILEIRPTGYHELVLVAIVTENGCKKLLPVQL